jgi:microcystin-dependent protein
MFAGSFAPAGWQFCDGRVLPISENETLFNLIGTTYGGNGEETFNLPNLQGRIPVGTGHGPGLANDHQLGEPFGVEQVTLAPAQLPSHTHALLASTAGGTTAQPAGNVLASAPAVSVYVRDAPDATMPATAVTPRGGSQPHENLMPFVAVSFIISLFGAFPTQ